MRFGAALLVVALALSAPASAAEGASISADEVRQVLSGNTLTGRYSNGQAYSEYHLPDGRVYGHNNRRPVVNGCWDMRGDLACYYYSEDKQRGPFCWSFKRLAGDGIQATFVDREGWEIIAVVQKGNPHGHSDNGKPWTCEPLQSRGMTPGSRTRLVAR